ncbi:response regulator [Egicoccus sp. AB-alg6-2]|uniref:response regulator n=1 Tax=Egicoccus sp. AB-alg6-2 TaxID=3242692 RepID=UPI00359D9A94
MRLLLVEDDLDLAALLQLVLGQAGFDIVLTDRVAGIVERAVDVDGVVTDGALLDGTADDVLEALQHDERTASLPVVVCSVRPDAIRHPQVVGRLRKPLDALTTAARLRRLFDGERAGSEAPLRASNARPPQAPPTLMGDQDGEAVRLRQRGLQELEIRARLIGDAGAAVLCGDLTVQRREDARVAAHKSIGLAGALGEHDLAEPARRAERLLLRDGALGVDDAVELCEVAAALEDEARGRIDAAPVREARAVARATAAGLVAIVDDDEILVALVRRRLELAGFEVVGYDHGGHALDELSRSDTLPDVLLLDVDLPGLNGLSVLDGLASTGALRDTRVVLATVHDNPTELARARAAAAEIDHLPKPYDLDRLVALVGARSRV